MKQIFTLAVKRLTVISILIGMQVNAWAVETATTMEDSDSSGSFFSKPWIWIAPIVVTIIILIGPFNDNKEFRVIMKKKKTKEVPVQH